MDETILVDTDILIDAGRNLPDAVSFLENAENNSPLAISVVTKMELIVGCRNKTEMRSVEQFLERFNLIRLNESISDVSIDLLRRYRLSHGLLIPDAIIAATAISVNASFVTKNQKDFRFISDLNLLAYQ
jgi:hypothetical protein